MAMTRNRRAEDVFWNLAALATDYVLKLPAKQLRPDALRSVLRAGTRICVPATGRRFRDVIGTAAELAGAGMCPVISARAPDSAALRSFDRTLTELRSVGARELVMHWPASAEPVEMLDCTARLVSECDFGDWNFTEITIVAGGHGWREPEPTADLLRAFEAVRIAREQRDVQITLRAPAMRSVRSIVEWERSLRAAGNLLPVRVRLPGIGPNPFQCTVPMLLGMAAALESDRESLLGGLQFVLRGSPVRTSLFADEISSGNFLIEEDRSGYQLVLL